MSDHEIDRLTPCRRPPGRPMGYQCWRDLAFVHWRLPAEHVAAQLPPELSVDVFDGDAWVGIVAFHMQGVRPWWFPALPGVSAFHETNLRTYVHWRGRPGVWFFSLDAAGSLGVAVGRCRWALPYYRARMRLHRADGVVCYRSRRLWPGGSGASLDLEVRVGERCAGPEGASPGTLEHFLAERYLLFLRSRRGEMLTGQVYHRPYPLHAARVTHLAESLGAAAGLELPAAPCHALYSPGVDVEIFPLRGELA